MHRVVDCNAQSKAHIDREVVVDRQAPDVTDAQHVDIDQYDNEGDVKSHLQVERYEEDDQHDGQQSVQQGTDGLWEEDFVYLKAHI